MKMPPRMAARNPTEHLSYKARGSGERLSCSMRSVKQIRPHGMPYRNSRSALGSLVHSGHAISSRSAPPAPGSRQSDHKRASPVHRRACPAAPPVRLRLAAQNDYRPLKTRIESTAASSVLVRQSLKHYFGISTYTRGPVSYCHCFELLAAGGTNKRQLLYYLVLELSESSYRFSLTTRFHLDTLRVRPYYP